MPGRAGTITKLHYKIARGGAGMTQEREQSRLLLPEFLLRQAAYGSTPRLCSGALAVQRWVDVVNGHRDDGWRVILKVYVDIWFPTVYASSLISFWMR